MSNLDIISNSGRLLELCQLYFLAVNKIISELQPNALLSKFRSLETIDYMDIEAELFKCLNEMRKNCRERFQELVTKSNLVQALTAIEEKEIEADLCDQFKLDSEALELCSNIISGRNLVSSSSLQRVKESYEHELSELRTANIYLQEEEDRILDEILQLRLNLITKTNL